MSNDYSDFTRQIDNARPVQIVSPADHAFQLELEQLENILLKDEIRDRYVVVVSIAGAYRKGKSFLMNFLLKYLNAQVSVVFVFIHFAFNSKKNYSQMSIN